MNKVGRIVKSLASNALIKLTGSPLSKKGVGFTIRNWGARWQVIDTYGSNAYCWSIEEGIRILSYCGKGAAIIDRDCGMIRVQRLQGVK
ncbi:MAG TPA: hypothetical protein VEQ18_05640 [Candidatus Nitrosocosmicus sp.]|nr:hypothetical protein [Candidatus Nitrosocosmicus sp.]